MVYHWQLSDGQVSPTQQMVFAGPGSQTISWTVSHPAVEHISGTATVFETSPNNKNFPLPYDWNIPYSCIPVPSNPPYPLTQP